VTILAQAPAHIKPVIRRIKKTKEEEKKKAEVSVDTSVYKGFTKQNILTKYLADKNTKQRKHILEFIEMYAKDVLTSKAFMDLSSAQVAELLKLDKLNCKEVDVFNAVNAWGTAECKRQKKDTSEMATVLKEIIPLIRFPTMEIAEVATLVDKSGFLTQEQLIALFTYIGSRSINTKASPDSCIKVFSSKARDPRWPIGAFKFDTTKKGNLVAITEDGMKITQTSGTTSWNTTLLTPKITQGKHVIRFRINSDNRSHWIMIGVCEASYSNLQNYIGSSTTPYSKGWSNAGTPGGSGKIYPSYSNHGTAFRTGDTVTMTIDMTAKTVHYKVNDQENTWGAAITDLPNEILVGVTTYDESDSVSIAYQK
jgi:hypothetical protein